MADYQPSFETLVHLAEKRGVLLASVLAIYQQRYNLSDAQLSEQLHCRYCQLKQNCRDYIGETCLKVGMMP
ncbi:hypothetical protein [Ktedonobacter racemifer]|uniref:Uncharacterized protein n=1 Tax=Ktedonobacter racemifer DSM 44963 TaxID=485913 RepID=D6TUQ9_KTERA|nr:hypothetical protein [Ktedonobacter racemifer]EFH85235.1 hypothetical protein Krac_6414 [Ktedonobacter racemifer DSM 44963]